MIRRWIGIFRRRRDDGALDEEVRTHLDFLAEDFVRRGMTEHDARAAARREFGGVDQMKERYRDQRGLPWLDELARDVRYGLRQLRRNPGFAAVAVATLAFGIAATTAMFSVVNAVILQPLAYRDAGRLMAVHTLAGTFGRIPVNDAHFDEWRRSARTLEAAALLAPGGANLTGNGEPRRLSIAQVSSRLFTTIGVQPQLGRTFADEEEAVGHDRVIILSDEFWRTRFGSDRNVIGRTMALDGVPHEVVGVLPPAFHFPSVSALFSIPIAAEAADVWKPLALSANSPLHGFNFACIVRLQAGVSIEQATEELNALQARSDISAPPGQRGLFRVSMTPLQEQVTGRVRLGLQLLLAAVGAVLLIACVNVTTLLLARSSARGRELAIRGAIGASRGRLTRQMFTESLILVALGAAAGVALAGVLLTVLHRVAPADLPRLDEIHLNVRVLAAGLAISTVTALLVGILPALRFAGVDFNRAMRATTHSDPRGQRIRSLLVSAEIAMSLACLIASGLVFRSFVNVIHVDKGFETARVLTLDLNLPASRYRPPAALQAFQRAALDRLAAIPGVVSVGLSNKQLLSGEGINLRVRLDSWNLSVADLPLANIRAVNADYFRALGIAIRSGRVFDDTDRSRPVAVISAQTAERLWPGEPAIGQTFRRGGGPGVPLVEVVGVARDVRGSTLEKTPMFTVYVPYWQFALGALQPSFTLKTAADPVAVASDVRAAIRALDPELPMPSLRTLDEVVGDSVAGRRFQTLLLTLFGAASLLLATLGVYGVIAFAVGQRTSEIGIRIALGASRWSVERRVIGDALKLVAGGLIVSVPLTLASAASLRAALFGIGPQDPITIAGACLALTIAAVVAALGPALRASRVDPMVALRPD
jgi:predicted permease